MAKWRFEDVHRIFGEDDGEGGSLPHVWEFEINPEEGGQPAISHNVTTRAHVGPWPSVTMQQGRQIVPRMAFSGKVLTQEQYEAFERWYLYRILLDVVDDLGRRFRGVLVRWDPERVRKPYDPWYHEYRAEFAIWAGTNASGEPVYGHMEDDLGADFEPIPDPEDIGDDPLPAPTGLNGQFISPTEMDLSWRAVDGAAAYRIEVDGVVVEESNVGTLYTVHGAGLTEAIFRVAALDSFGLSSEWSESYSVMPPGDQTIEGADILSVTFSEDSDVVATTFTQVGASDALTVDLDEDSGLETT